MLPISLSIYVAIVLALFTSATDETGLRDCLGDDSKNYRFESLGKRTTAISLGEKRDFDPLDKDQGLVKCLTEELLEIPENFRLLLVNAGNATEEARNSSLGKIENRSGFF
ncbi:hypothetical protein OXX80_005473 [Metschnikowia pulcherrima]